MLDKKLEPKLRPLAEKIYKSTDVFTPEFLIRLKKLNNDPHEIDQFNKWVEYFKAVDYGELPDLIFDKIFKIPKGPPKNLNKDKSYFPDDEPIKLSKIPKVPKVPSKKLMKDIPEYDHKIPSKMIKSNDKVLKELDDLLKEVDELINKAKPKPKPKRQQSTKTVTSTTRTRCPNGTRKNKKTGLCEKCELSSTTKPTTTKSKSTTKPSKAKLMTKKEEKEIMKKINEELRKVNKILKPEVKGKLSAEEKEFRAMLRKTKSEQNKKAKKEMIAKSKAEAKAKLEAHKKEAEAEKLRLQRANLRKSKEIDELKSDFTMFRRYVRYLPTPEEATQLSGKALESAKDYLADAEMYYRNAVDTYKKYKKEGLIEKSELDKLMELFEVKYHVDVMNSIKPLLEL